MHATLTQTTTSLSSAEAHLMRVESARYALLRRLAYAMRHQLVMHLQPIGMVTEVMDRRLRAPSPDLNQVQEGMSKINGFSKAAVQACLDVITWMAPEPGATLAVDAGVKDCMDLLRSNFGFRGFNVRSGVEALPQKVGKSALRMLLPATLVAISDAVPAPADILLDATADDDVVRLALRVQPTQAEVGPVGELPYRPMSWDEVAAMARSEDVELERTADGGAVLTFPALD